MCLTAVSPQDPAALPAAGAAPPVPAAAGPQRRARRPARRLLGRLPAEERGLGAPRRPGPQPRHREDRPARRPGPQPRVSTGGAPGGPAAGPRLLQPLLGAPRWESAALRWPNPCPRRCFCALGGMLGFRPCGTALTAHTGPPGSQCERLWGWPWGSPISNSLLSLPGWSS